MQLKIVKYLVKVSIKTNQLPNTRQTTQRQPFGGKGRADGQRELTCEKPNVRVGEVLLL